MLPLFLIQVVGAEGGSAGCPDRSADLTLGDCSFDGLHLRAQDLTRRRDDPQVLRLRQLDQFRGFGGRGGHCLVEMDVLAGFQRRLALLVVEADRRRDGDRRYVAIFQQVLERGGGVGQPELVGGCLGATLDRIADGLQRHPVLHVGQAEVGEDSALGDGSRAHDAHSYDLCHSVALLGSRMRTLSSETGWSIIVCNE